METQTICPDIEMIRIGEVHSSYLIRDEPLTLIETPHPKEADELIEGLTTLGVRPKDLQVLVTTHIHLDHAGAAGHLARENPELVVHVHEAGLPHLVDPERINRSAERAYGSAFGAIGKMLPIPESQVRGVFDGTVISLTKTRWQVIHTPGHAGNHICLFEPARKILFVGDALGCLCPGVPLFIVTPAPEYDQALALASIRRLASLEPECIIFTHLGPCRDRGVFSEAEHQHIQWVDAMEKILESKPDAGVEEALDLLAAELPLVRDFSQHYGFYALNVMGIKRYLSKRARPA